MKKKTEKLFQGTLLKLDPHVISITSHYDEGDKDKTKKSGKRRARIRSATYSGNHSSLNPSFRNLPITTSAQLDDHRAFLKRSASLDGKAFLEGSQRELFGKMTEPTLQRTRSSTLSPNTISKSLKPSTRSASQSSFSSSSSSLRVPNHHQSRSQDKLFVEQTSEDEEDNDRELGRRVTRQRASVVTTSPPVNIPQRRKDSVAFYGIMGQGVAKMMSATEEKPSKKQGKKDKSSPNSLALDTHIILLHNQLNHIKQENKNKLGKLPIHLWTYIFSCLPPTSLILSVSASKFWLKLSENKNFWKACYAQIYGGKKSDKKKTWKQHFIQTTKEMESHNRYEESRTSQLMYAVRHHLYRTVHKMLLEDGASLLNSKLYTVIHPLHVAVQENNYEMCCMLLHFNANVNIPSFSVISPLQTAALNGNPQLCSLLLAHGAEIEGGSPKWATPLFLAVQNKHIEVIKLLIQHGANINAHCLDGKTSLHTAVESADISIINLLLAHDAEILEEDDYGRTPKDLGEEIEEWKVVEHMRSLFLGLSPLPPPSS